MLRSYLYQWFSILGMTFPGKDLWYIDGFAGPGEYTNYSQGSPIAALAAAAEAINQNKGRWLARDIHCFFIEDTRSRFDHLRGKLDETAAHPRVHRGTFYGSFVDGCAWLKQQAVNPFQGAHPIFAFIDPFGPAGLSFSIVRDLLSRPACEVLINLDSDGVSRINQAGEDANHHTLLNEVFGDSSWEPELAGVQQNEAVRKVLALYKAKLRGIPDVRYAFSFEMRKKKQQFDYHLVFASQHARGLQKMKEVMRKIDKTGNYCFSDDVGQQSLFTFDDPAAAAQQMLKHFYGRTVKYEDVNDFALNESPFPNPKSMLKILEKAEKIAVQSAGRKRMRYTYPDDLHELLTIRF